VGVVLLFLKGALFGDPDTPLEHAASNGLNVAYGVLFAAAGINGVFRGIQHRRWKKQTAPVARDLIHQISNDLVALAKDAFRVVSPAIPPGFANPVPPNLERDVPAAFGLAAVQRTSAYPRLEEAVEAARNALLSGALDANAQGLVVAAANEVASKVDARGDELKDRVGELAAYRTREADALIEAAVRLAGSTDDLAHQVEDDGVTLIGSAAANVFFRCDDLNGPLTRAYWDVVSILRPNLPRSVYSEPG
jgi:hypothetical protein